MLRRLSGRRYDKDQCQYFGAGGNADVLTRLYHDSVPWGNEIGSACPCGDEQRSGIFSKQCRNVLSVAVYVPNAMVPTAARGIRP